MATAQHFSVLNIKVDNEDEVKVISYGSGCYAVRGNMDEEHQYKGKWIVDYSKDYTDADRLIRDIIAGTIQWITTDPNND